MAYSDYGGYAFRDGLKVDDRSDAVISNDNTVIGSPGIYPGFAAYAEGGEALAQERIAMPRGHAILGDGPLLVALYKQSSVQIFIGNKELKLLDLVNEKYPQAITYHEHKGEKYSYLNSDYFSDSGEVMSLDVEGHKIEVKYLHTDNYYVHCKVTQPNGVVWTGFSGYGVGAGLEDCDYGFSTEQCVDDMKSVWSI